MFERILLAVLISGAGLIAYRGLLWYQRRRAAQGSSRSGGTGRSRLLVFTSPTCAPCKLQQLPIVDRILLDCRDKIEVDVIDVTVRPEVASQYGVWSLPTTIVLDASRKVVAINQGVAHERKLREQLERAAEANDLRTTPHVETAQA